MTIAEILALLPSEMEVTLRPINGTVEYIDTAGAWLEDDGQVHRLEDFELITDIQLPDPPDPNAPTDLFKLMSGEPPEEEWMVEPILPRGKLIGIISKRGDGKSLVTLDIAAKRAAGLPILGHGHDKPAHVVYLDMEMGPDDLFDRLFSLGWTTDHPQFGIMVEHLHYYQLITIPPLDTEAGGQALDDLVDKHNAVLVIIDTVSRVVSGDENTAEPYRELFRHTETRLKRRGVTLARLDHVGKDTERGSRGSSAKEDPLDVVWHLTQTADDMIHLKLTKGRQDWVPRQVSIKRTFTNGILSHELPVEFAPAWLLELVTLIDSLGLPDNTPAKVIQETLRDLGKGQRRKAILEAVRYRKSRFETTDSGSPDGSRWGTAAGTASGTVGNRQDETSGDLQLFGEPPGEPLGTGKGRFPPLEGGTAIPSDPELDLPNPFE